MYFVLAFCVAWLVSVCSCLKHEVKSPGAQIFCGDHFIKTWELICQLKLLRRNRVPRAIEKSPSVEQFLKKVVVSRNQANSYLRHPRSVTGERMDNATEECCKESCTYDEIAEYDC